MGVGADDPGQVGRLTLPPTLLVCAAMLAVLVPAASAATPKLPAGADAPPMLPPGVVPADAPVHATTPQAPSSAGPLLAPGAFTATSATKAKPWATVNICDTDKTPNGLGVRASMPGNGKRQLMYMRFTAQYWSPSRNEWVTVPGGGSSRWVYSGSARYAERQMGWTFFFDQPPFGTTFVMRAVVEQQWRAERSERSTRGLRQGEARKQSAKRKAREHAAKHRARKARKRHARKRAMERKVRKQVALLRVHKRHGSTRKLHWKHAAKRSHASGRRAHYTVVKRQTILTKTGYEGVDGGDPPGTSKAMCLIW
jgi:hypothetical protein